MLFEKTSELWKKIIIIIVVVILLGFIAYNLVVALIATKSVNDVIDKSSLSYSKDGAYSVVHAAESWYSEYFLSNGENPPATVFGTENGQTSFSELPIKGSKPVSGTIKVTSDGNVSLNKLEIDGFCWSSTTNRELEQVSCD